MKKEGNTHISGGHNSNVGNHSETNNYNVLTIDDTIKMLEERFQHMLKKDSQIEEIFEENRKLTEALIKQLNFFISENKKLTDQAIKMEERIEFLTNKLINK